MTTHYKQQHQHNYQVVEVLLLNSELRYDIDFITNRLSRFITQGDNNTTAVQSTQTEDNDNNDFISRLLTSALATLKQRTSWASGLRGSRMVTDEIPEDPEDYCLVFHLPLDWRGDAAVVCALAHEYLKNKVLADWCLLTIPDHSTIYSATSDGNLGDLAYELRKAPPKQHFYDLTGA